MGHANSTSPTAGETAPLWQRMAAGAGTGILSAQGTNKSPAGNIAGGWAKWLQNRKKGIDPSKEYDSPIPYGQTGGGGGTDYA